MVKSIEKINYVIEILKEKRALTPEGYYIEIHAMEYEDLVIPSDLRAILYKFHHESQIIEIAEAPLTALGVQRMPLRSLSCSPACHRIILLPGFDNYCQDLEGTSKNPSQNIHPKRLKSMAKIIAGFARIYGHNENKKKNTATGEGPKSMVAALTQVGITIDADVVRQCVEQSCELLDLDLD
jgi:hypothetical protein